MRILLVEDDKALAKSIHEAMVTFNHSVEKAENGEDALLFLENYEFDSLILDLSLPDMDGLEVLEKIRKQKKGIPILILTARNQLNSRLTMLDAGADDYLTKPFNIRELESRLRAIVRRSNFEIHSKISIENFLYDSSTRKVFIDGKEIPIPRKELILLDLLLHRPEQVVSAQKILDTLYSAEEEVHPKVVDLYVHRLRKRLAKTGGLRLINLKGLGYYLDFSKKS